MLLHVDYAADQLAGLDFVLSSRAFDGSASSVTSTTRSSCRTRRRCENSGTVRASWGTSDAKTSPRMGTRIGALREMVRVRYAEHQANEG
ncbi:hypothetical protein A0H81_13957 [Grifola frondosa]|uniref:Uncharacterized protein n=1 Tax=Grifola frondosa TaxID=5627 RepID=A0A1C7LMT6_GRIFR|nr:hypothetical protein A0H81_13957 [Grifola frondosa]